MSTTGCETYQSLYPTPTPNPNPNPSLSPTLTLTLSLTLTLTLTLANPHLIPNPELERDPSKVARRPVDAEPLRRLGLGQGQG